jgi:hypothetical protein
MRAAESGLYFDKFPAQETLVLPCLLFAACLVYLRAARELWFNIGFWGFLGLLWVTPPLACMVIYAGWEEGGLNTLYHLGSLSPPFAFFEIAGRPQDMDLDEHENAFRQAAIFGVIFSILIALILSVFHFLQRRKWEEREKSIAANREFERL